MQVVALSDTHLTHSQLEVPDGDLFLFAGDFESTSISRLRAQLDWLQQLPHKYKVFIAGNHDFIFQTTAINLIFTEYSVHKPLAQSLLQASAPGLYYLENSGVIINKKLIWGTPNTPSFGSWAFMESEAKLGRRFQQMPQKLDILISHGPPYGILDKTETGIHAGSSALLEASNLREIKHHLFGHIHPHYEVREQHSESRSWYNVGVTDDQLNVIHKPTIFKL